ncbi:hypothetical protein ACFX2J_003283 [Malus domestica]
MRWHSWLLEHRSKKEGSRWMWKYKEEISLLSLKEGVEIEHWRTLIIHYLKDLSSPTSKKIRQQTTKFVMWDRTLLRKTPDGLLLKCFGVKESMMVMAEGNEGIYGTHQAGIKMRCLLRRYGYCCPDMENDCNAYVN